MGKKKRGPSRPAPGLRFPADEARHPWLPVLLRTHAIVDAGVETAVRAEERRRGARRACRRGCAVCCRTQSDIPVFEIELAALSWFATEKLEGPVRTAVREQLAVHVPGAPVCPFLVADSCAVHPVRPMACRLFTVFGRPCATGEDPFHERRSEMLTPPPGLLERAYRSMLPFHGVTEPRDQETWLAGGLVKTLAVNLPSCTWVSLAGLMDTLAQSPSEGKP